MKLLEGKHKKLQNSNNSDFLILIQITLKMPFLYMLQKETLFCK